MDIFGGPLFNLYNTFLITLMTLNSCGDTVYIYWYQWIEWINGQTPFSYSTNIYYWVYYLLGCVLDYLQRKSRKPVLSLQTWLCLVSKQIPCHIKMSASSLNTIKLRQWEKTRLFSSFYLKYFATKKVHRAAIQTQTRMNKLSWITKSFGGIEDLGKLPGGGSLGEHLSCLLEITWVPL